MSANVLFFFIPLSNPLYRCEMTTRYEVQLPTRDCHAHCCSGFYRLERLSHGFAGPSLTNPIHPIFASTRVSSEMNYAALEPSLRLATHLLRASLPFFHHIEFANVVPISIDPRGKESYELQRDSRPLTSDEEARTALTLVQFANLMNYRLTPISTSGSAVAASSTDLGSLMQDGKTHSMIISLDRDLHAKAVDIYNGRADLVETHWHLFNIAVTLVHELVHAFTTTFTSAQQYTAARLPDMYFPGSLCAEEGFEWENRTFGGILSAKGAGSGVGIASHFFGGARKLYYSFIPLGGEGKPSHDGGTVSRMETMISMAEWPYLAQVERYQACNLPIGRRGTLPEVHTRWNVDLPDIHKLFEDPFWTRPLVPGSLHFPKVTGQRFFGSDQAGSRGREKPFEMVIGDDYDNVDCTTGVPAGCSVQYNPPNGGTGLILAPGVEHPFGPDGATVFYGESDEDSSMEDVDTVLAAQALVMMSQGL